MRWAAVKPTGKAGRSLNDFTKPDRSVRQRMFSHPRINTNTRVLYIDLSSYLGRITEHLDSQKLHTDTV